MYLTRWAALASGIAVLVVLAVRSWPAVGIVTGLLVLAVAVDVIVAPSPARLDVERSGDTSIRLGEAATSTLVLTNTGRRRIRARVRNAWIPSAGASGGLASVVLPPGGRRRTVTRLLPTRRGDRHAGPVAIRTAGPLRLAGRQAVREARWTLRVLPPFSSRKHLPSRLAQLRELDGRSVVLQRGEGTEFDSLREYVPGDDVRSIDWRGTARASAVVVRTWRPERDRHVLVVLDAGRTSAGRVEDQPKLDHAMDAALLLAVLASHAGDRVDLLVVDGEVRARVERVSTSELLPRFVNAMAPIEPILAESDPSLIATETLRMAGQRSLVVLLTGLDRASLTEGLLPVFASVIAKHRVVVASVSDPGVDEMLAAHGDATDAYAAAAAQVDVERRAAAADELQRAGVDIVQAPPARFAPALADHYLALKRTGRL